MKINELLRTLKFIGWENPYRAILYSIMRDRLDRPLERERKLDPSAWAPPGDLMGARSIAHGAEFDFEQASLEIIFLSNEVIRVSWQPGEPPVPYAIQDHLWPGADPILTEGDRSTKLAVEDLSIQLSSTGELTWWHDDRLIRQEQAPLHNNEAWRLSCPLGESDAVFGLGGRTSRLNLRPGSYQLWNHDPGGSYGHGDDPLYLNVPTLLVLGDGPSYLVFHENSYRGQVEIDGELSVQFDGGMLRYYLFFGDLTNLYARYSELTGKPPLPPRWALGLHQSRWGYRNENAIQQVLQGFREHQLPLSAIHLDIDHMDGYRVFTTDARKFPNLQDLNDQAAQQEVRLVTIIDPGVKIDRGFRLYRDGIQADLFCKLPNDRPLRAPVWPGWVHFPDFSNPDARRWWQQQYPRMLKHGISGIWHDMNEPAAFAAWGAGTLPLATRHALEGKGGRHTQAHNLYGLLMNQAGFQACRDHRPDKRPFILSRSGWAGNQRYAWNWTGDVESTWEGLTVSLNLMLGMSMSGIVFTGSDIGGFSGDPTPELMLRWLQMAAFTPFFRIHSAITVPAREPWRFPEPYMSAMRTMLRLRYRLKPYLYSLAHEASVEGTPLMRPFFWEEPDDPAHRSVEDQFFFGDSMLIAPVLQPGTDHRQVLLPSGRWYSFWDDTAYDGPQEVTVDTPLERIPVFVRGGTIIPQEAERPELHLYYMDRATSEGVIYYDEGDGYAPGGTDVYQLTQSDDSIQIKRQVSGSFPSPYDRAEIHLHGADARAFLVDGQEMQDHSLPFHPGPFEQLIINL